MIFQILRNFWESNSIKFRGSYMHVYIYVSRLRVQADALSRSTCSWVLKRRFGGGGFRQITRQEAVGIKFVIPMGIKLEKCSHIHERGYLPV